MNIKEQITEAMRNNKVVMVEFEDEILGQPDYGEYLDEVEICGYSIDRFNENLIFENDLESDLNICAVYIGWKRDDEIILKKAWESGRNRQLKRKEIIYEKQSRLQ